MTTDGLPFSETVVKGLLWIGSGTFIGQAVSWGCTLFVIRILSPSEYGLMAMAGTFLALITMLSELGIGSSIVQAKEITDRQIRQVFAVVIIFCLLSFVLSYLLAPMVAAFYDEARLTAMVKTLSITFLLTMAYIIPQSLVMREMDFKKRAQIDLAAQVGSALCTLCLAILGLGAWALVYGALSFHVIKLIAYHVSRVIRIMPLFNLRQSSVFVSFGLTLTGSRFLYYAFRQADNIIVGRFLGDVALGIYSVGLNLATIPAEKLLPIINQVSFTSYARIQSDRDRVRRNVLRSVRLVAALTFPIFMGMAAVAPEAIHLLLGEKWRSVVFPFQLICLSLPLKSLDPVLAPAVFAVGRPLVNLTNMAITAGGMTLAFLVAVPYGIIGICYAWVFVFPVVFFIICLRCLSVLHITLGEFLCEVRFPLLVSFCMLLLIVGSRVILEHSNAVVFLVIAIITGAAFYLSMLMALDRARYLGLRDLLRKRNP